MQTEADNYTERALEWVINNPLTRLFFKDSPQGTKDVLVSMIPQVVGVVTGFVASIMTARGLGPTGLGQFTLVLSLSAIATTLTDLGIGQTAIRFASRAIAQGKPEEQMMVMRWAFRVRMSLALLVIAIFYALVPILAVKFWHDPQLIPWLRLGLAIGFFDTIASVPAIYFQSLKKFETNAFVISAQKIISFLGISLLFLLNKWSVYLVILVTIITSAFSALAFLIIIPKSALWSRENLRLSETIKWRQLWQSPKFSSEQYAGIDPSPPSSFAFYMLLSSIIVMLTNRADVWLMGYFLDKSQIGIYTAGTRFTLPLVIILGAMNTALWPRASACTDIGQTTILLKKTFKLSALVSALGAIYSLTAPLLASFLFGKAYAESTSIGQLLCLGYCIAILGCPVGIIGYSFGLVKIYWIFNLSQFVVTILLLIKLLPRYGALGAGWAFLVNATLGISLTLIFIKRYNKKIKNILT